jgi:hypothetical protein
MTATSTALPVVHRGRIEAVLEVLTRRYDAREYPYNQPGAKLPQEFLPHNMPRGGVTEAMFFMRLCTYMRGGIQSDTAARLLTKLYHRRPQLFDPHWVVKAAQPEAISADESELLQRDRAQRKLESSIRLSLVKVGLKYMQNIAPGYWIENDRLLVELYDGDPRKIFAGVTDYEEACDRVLNRSRWKWIKASNPSGREVKIKFFTRRQGFLGYQFKMVSMLMYYLMDAELVPYFEFPAPVDFHLMRVSVATEMVTFTDMPPNRNIYSDELQAVLRAAFQEYAERHGITAIKLANVLWLYSGLMCSVHPGNTTWNSGYNARSTLLTPHEPTWNKSEQQRNSASCGACPLAKWCVWDVPNAQYTRRGELLLLRERTSPLTLIEAVA